MHEAFFSLKRAHHSVLRIGRPLLLDMGLTPARFDLLFALKLQDRRRMLQRELQETLGVGRTTVSRMLASLEKLGFVQRSIDPKDRRRKWVALTKRGFWRIGSAYRRFSRSGWAQLALDTALGAIHSSPHPADWSDKERCAKTEHQLLNTLWGIRQEFRDCATLEYGLVDADWSNPFNWFCEDELDD
jgi:DNA-binding MarR family transcriptional regulator